MKASIILCSTLFLSLTILEAIHSLSTSVDLSLRELNEILRKDKREDSISDKDLLLSFNNYLSRQLMLQQLFVEERIRSDGGSGIKQVRLASQGSKPYFVSSHTGNRIAAIHEHSNNIRINGLGEFVGVLNGVEFRTRHNDYKSVKPHSTSSKYHETEDIVYPEVPPSVKAKATVAEQIAEMKEYFRAWKEEDTTIRDYKDYFKPMICYLEGTWTLSASDEIQDPFESDRHKLAAKSWLDLQEKVRFMSYTGKKDPLENFAYLPTTILKQENETLQLAQWNYRILCHPLKKHIDPSRLCLVDDLQARMGRDYTLDEYRESRAARFKVSMRDDNKCSAVRVKYSLLDELMEEVPGLNNYQGNLVDDSLGTTAQHYKTGETLNAAYYHRLFKTSENDAMGVNTQYRGFADPEVFFAMTDKENVAPMSVKKCDSDGGNCVTTTQRWTYAVPLEIIFMTPLYNWNPHDIEYKGWSRSDIGKTVTANGRNGEAGDDKAYDGTHNQLYYLTPAEFFETDDVTGDAADTAKGVVYVLGGDNKAHAVRGSGTRITLPPIGDLGVLRTRYPVMPIHFEQSVMWKEISALKEVALGPKSYKDMYYEQFPEGTPEWVEPTPQPATATVVCEMKPSNEATNSHTHQVALVPDQYLSIGAGTPVTVTTSEAEGHTHELTLVSNTNGHFKYIECDGRTSMCADRHGRAVKPIPL